MRRQWSYAERVPFCKNPIAKELFSIMQEKQSNLALSADVTDCKTLLALAKQCGREICLLKTHIDILEDFSEEFIHELKDLATQDRFLIFEDRKFADIGHTVKLQYSKGIYHIAEWADIINAHSLPGPAIISGLAEVGLPKKRALLLLAEMSSSGHLFDANYTEKTIEMAKQHPEFVIGFIALRQLVEVPYYVYLTPGVQLSENQDGLGQQYRSPEKILTENLSDVIIVGRGIIQAEDPKAEAQKYRKAGWAAYERSLGG